MACSQFGRPRERTHSSSLSEQCCSRKEHSAVWWALWFKETRWHWLLEITWALLVHNGQGLDGLDHYVVHNGQKLEGLGPLHSTLLRRRQRHTSQLPKEDGRREDHNMHAIPTMLHCLFPRILPTIAWPNPPVTLLALLILHVFSVLLRDLLLLFLLSLAS